MAESTDYVIDNTISKSSGAKQVLGFGHLIKMPFEQ